jgi:7-cyano-7-deazaguanine synthase in queuosine biosynthesis
MQLFEELKKQYTDEAFKNRYESYHNKVYPNIHDVNGLPFHFDAGFKRIGLSLSGGADSSLLFYILCKLIEETNSECKILPTTMVRFFDTKPWLEKPAKDVYAWMKEQFPDIIEEHNWGFIPPYLEVVKIKKLGLAHLNKNFPADLMFTDVLCTISYHEYLIKTKKLDYIYSGTTMNPPEDFENAPQFRNQAVTDIDGISNVVNANSINPFSLITKDWIMAQYENYNLHELLELTRSCEADTKLLGEMWLTVDDVQPPACGTCFFCKERQWGIDNSKKYLIKK